MPPQTYSKTIGPTGADYADLGSWQTARLLAAEAVSDDIEEAVLLDYASHGSFSLSTSWPAGVNVVVRAQNSHLGDWTVSSQGASFTPTGGAVIIATGTYNAGVTLSLVDLVIQGHPSTSFRHAVSANAANLTLRITRCMLKGRSTGSNGLNLIPVTAATQVTVCENSVFVAVDAAQYGVSNPFGNGSLHNFTATGCYIDKLYGSTGTGQTFDPTLDGCLVGTITGGAGTRTATDSIRSAGAWTGWTTVNCSTGAFVTGTPAVGEVGFTDMTTYDFSLVDHADNLAVEYCENATMPSDDIIGETRPQGTYADAGPFELVPTPTVEPDAPTDLTVEALTTTSVQLSWTDNASNEQNFKVEYRTQGSTGAWTTASSAIVANATGYTVTGLATGSYEFRIAATNVVGSSAYATATGSTRLFKTGVSKGVGVNLERLNYFNPETPFYDIWRSTGEWQDIDNASNVVRAPADVDVNNNPLSITGAKLRKYIRLNDGSTTQVWVLLYDGSGTFSLGNVSNQVATSGRIEFTMNSGNVWLDITSIGTLSNFRVFRIEDESLYATNIFRQDFLDTWSAVRCFRYLNWGSDGTISDGSRADCVFSGSGSATITKASHGLLNGYRVWFLTVPTGGELTAATYYYVVNATTDTFEVAATKGGTAITVAASSGLTHSLFFVVRSSLWADRPTLSTSGMKYNEVPLEIIIAHSNATGKDCWVQVPYVVDDDFVENMAILFRDGITGNQKIYVEYSNECWNFSFPQASYCKNQASVSADPFVAAVYGANEYHGGYVWFGMRTKEVMDIWATVFAGQENRLVRVLSWQAADSSAAADAMSYPGIIDSIDAVAIGPYAGGGIGATGAFGSTAVGDIIDLLIADIADTVQTWAPAYVTAWRDDYGLRILGYEGGTHLYATTGDSAESDKFADVNRDAGIYQFVQDYLTAWHAESDDLLCWYKTTSGYGQYGYWGLRESDEQTRDDSYKMDSFLDYIEANTASSSSGRRRYLRLGLGLR